MLLTREEQRILDGEEGPGKQKAMEILAALGKIYDASRLFPVKSVQVAGVSYSNLGDAGLEFLEELAATGVKATVPAMLNPAGMDLLNWKKLGVPKEFAEKQLEVINAYKKMGIRATCTCTPYLIGVKPEYGQHLAWSESSAVTYINSAVGARTNREGGPSALAAAIIGKTPYYGLHLKKNRKPQLLVNVKTDIERISDFGALGYWIGKNFPGKIPLITGIPSATVDELKSLSASIVTYGGPPLFHIEGITPEALKGIYPKPEEKIVVDEEEIKDARAGITDETGKVDFVAIGCPHASLEEIKFISELLRGKRVEVETWITTSRRVMEMAKRRGYLKAINKAGAKVVPDTCMAVAPLKGRFHVMATNSAKACYYGRGSNKFKTLLCTTEECMSIATGGKR
ncbi:MAG: aconitase X catalytic domain-containing protein [Candidatus Diapherotrites archaeon]|nr:aconitase X catalytic domain-containing protein [Candidatus Diapherotrites archaeon]